MNTKKGYTLLVVLGVGLILSASAILLFSTSNDDVRIAANSRRVLQSKLAAVSGITHFKSMELFYEHPMITKSPTWNMVVEGLKDLHQAKKFTGKVMKQIKELDEQNDKSPN